MYAVPSCSRDIEFYEFEPSTVSALTVCFCCLSNNTPVINATSCTHTEFVQQYFTEWSPQKLAICYTCHYMLKKIEIFRRQVRDSLELLSDYQHTKEQNLNRPRLVNHIVRTEMFVSSYIPSTKDLDDINLPMEAPVEIYVNDQPGTSKEPDLPPTIDIDSEQNLKNPRLVRTEMFVTSYIPSTKNNFDLNPPVEAPVEIYINDRPGTSKEAALPPTIVIDSDKVASDLLQPVSVILQNRMNRKKAINKKMRWIKDRKYNFEKLQTKSIDKCIETDIEKSIKSSKIYKNNVIFKKKHRDLPFVGKINPRRKPETENSKKLFKHKKNVLNKITLKKNLEKTSPNKPKYKTLDILSMRGELKDELDEKYEKKIEIIKLTRQQFMLERANKKQSENYIRKPFKCETCVQAFCTEFLYEKHKAKNHPSDRRNYETTCNICDTAIKTERGILGHLKHHILRYSCCECGIKSRMFEPIQKHYKVVHKQSIKCKDCNQTFLNRHKLLLHRRRDHRTKCIYCDKPFLTKIDLAGHYNKFHPKKYPYKCDHCTEKFKHSIALGKHKQKIKLLNSKNKSNKVNKSKRNKEDNIIVIDDDEKEKTKNSEPVILGYENINRGMENNEPEVPDNNGNDVTMSENSIEIVKDGHNVAELENIEPNIVGIKNVDHVLTLGMEIIKPSVIDIEQNDPNIIIEEYNVLPSIIEMQNIEPNILGMENNDQNVVKFEMEILKPSVVEKENNGQNVVVEEYNVVPNIKGIEIIKPNVVEMENNGPKIVEKEKNYNNVIVKYVESNIVEMENKGPTIVEKEKNNHKVTVEYAESNVEKMENKDLNIEVMENNGSEMKKNDIVEMENDHNIDMENDHSIQEMENNDQNIQEMENNDQNIQEMENNDQNIQEMENNDHNIQEVENNDHNIQEMENNKEIMT